ncbi:prepilin-type N-terminal cleavage/methylation domain-containing protein [Sulfurovum sp.]|uniref:prepilin-type N-terminal cleavage/methylation domain-containing protein n=1 Tax=Sulfurovum sp. TaxID=1969726 RepID=UPI0025E5F266|nr:prepilin-type N-terminal cleavage/methylation domain-containing protein [Sulfurovum sp.]
MKIILLKKGFTLLEVVFVIVILGIVSSIGSSLIAQLYENYIVQNAMHRVTLKTELAVNQIVNRLTYRIGNSVITRKSNGTYIPLVDMIYDTNGTDRAVLEWIGYDNESFSSKTRPGWSGYCDVNASTASTGISTPGSRLNKITKPIIQNLSGSNSMPPLALLFSLNGQKDGTNFQNPDCFGYDGNTSCIHQVSIRNNTTFRTNRASGGANTMISDQYKLAWSAYAIVAVNKNALYPEDGGLRNGNIVPDADNTPRSFDLEIRYGYQPWAGTHFDDVNTPRSTLIRNVTSFKYAEQGGTIRIKLCATERVGDTNSSTNVSACKEKVVMR